MAWWLLLVHWTVLVDVASSLEWPYSEVVPQLADQIAQCTKVSGFEFTNGTLITAAQAAATCPDPSCIAVVSTIIEQYVENLDAVSQALAYSRFAMPVVYLCWFFRMPDDLCSTDPYNDLDNHFRTKDEACARVTGMSIFDTEKDIGNHWLDFYESGELCPQECIDIARRLTFFGAIATCVVSNYPRHNAHMYYSFLVNAGCIDMSAGGNDWGYAYQPGWPLLPSGQSATSEPPALPALPTLPPPLTTAPSSPNVTSFAPGGGSSLQGDDEDSVVGDSKTASIPRPRTSRVKTPSPLKATKMTAYTNSTLTQSMNATKRHQSSYSPASNVSTGTARGSPHSSRDHDDTDSGPSPPTITQNANTRSKSIMIKLALTAPSIAIATLCILFVWIKRRRNRASSKEHDAHESYSEMTGEASDEGSQFVAYPDGIALEKALSVDSIRDIRIIGSGGHGIVYLVKDNTQDRLLASKRLAKNHQTNDQIASFLREIQLVSTLSHPCIVAFVGATWMHRTDIQALFEYMDGGDLRQYLDQTPIEPWNAGKISIALNIAQALAYVHAATPAPIVHRDLKSRNVLLSKFPIRAKISDFGVARRLSQNCSMTSGVGTSRWLAPEVITGGGDYTTSCDIYSFGVVLSELDTHSLPFEDLRGNDGTALPEITILSMVAIQGMRPTLSESCPPEIANLALACMFTDPKMRPGAAEATEALELYLQETRQT